ncbi:hypothetical protein A2U01_0096340, partial [Trifolium medium]|nr:hypothetical protein [Trifolium medium]
SYVLGYSGGVCFYVLLVAVVAF